MNQRPAYLLQRLLQLLRHGGVAFSRFDSRAVTDNVLGVMGVLLRAGGTRARARARGRPAVPPAAASSPAGQCDAIARASTRVKALLCLCRDNNIARFFTAHGERRGRILGGHHHARAVGHGAVVAGFFQHGIEGPRTSGRRRGWRARSCVGPCWAACRMPAC